MVVPQAASNENVLATDEDHDAIPNLVALRTNKLPTKANISATRKPAGNINNQTRTKLDHAMLTGKNKTSQLHRSGDTLIYCDAKTTSCMALHPPCPSMLGSLVPSNQILDTLTMEYLAMRARVRAERSVPKQLQNRCFAPYDAVKDQKIRSRLLQIALITQFLDRCFANYFRAAVLPLAKEHVDKLLDDSRKTIAKMQNKQGDPESADIGDLGRFCEQSACAKWHDSWDPNFTTTQRRDHEVLHYLQDALEIPYWEFMADIFLVCNVNSSTLIGEVVLRVLYSAKLDLLDGRRRLRDELALLQGDDAEDIIRITDGIDARITVLESIWDNASSNPDGTHQWLVSLLERPLLSPSVTPEKSSISLQDGKTSRQKETATLMALILVFIVAAIIPGYKAFAISMQENAVGSIHDADFWSLIQSSIMAVMGNIIMVVPLLKKSWLSPTYGLMWAFFALGLVFAVISVVLYPLLNPGWSSMVAFFGSIASVASVLIATQATAREGSNGEVKLKPD